MAPVKRHRGGAQEEEDAAELKLGEGWEQIPPGVLYSRI